MARIRTYQLDTTLTNNDYLLGNDGDNGAVVTKRFSLPDLQEFFSRGLGGNIPNVAPQGFLAYTDYTNRNLIARTPFRVTRVGRMTGVQLTITSTQLDMDLTTIATGGGVMSITNYNMPYDLNDFNGIQVTLNQPSLPGGSVTGTFGTLVEHIVRDSEGQPTGATRPFRYDESGNYIYDINVSGLNLDNNYDNLTSIVLSDTPIQLNVEIDGDLQIDGGLSIDANLVVDGTSTLTGDVNAGSNLNVTGNLDVDGPMIVFGDDNAQTTVDVHGLVRFTDPGEGIRFGPLGTGGDMSISTFTLDTQGNIVVQGAPDSDQPSWTFAESVDVNVMSTLTTTGIINNGTLSTDGLTNDGTLTQNGNVTIDGDVTIEGNGSSSVTISNGNITTVNEDGSSGPALERVTANMPTRVSGDSAELSSIQIGNLNFNLPELAAGTATALPGLSEDLSGSPIPFMFGTFFYGREQSTGALYQGDNTDFSLTFTGGTPTIAAGVTSIDLDDILGDGTISADSAAFETFRDARGDFNIFFVQSDYTGPSLSTATAGTTVIPSTADVYEVVAYDETTNVLTFGKLGEGTLNISSGELSVGSDTVTYSNMSFTVTSGTVEINSTDIELPGIPLEDLTAQHNFVTIDNNNELSRSNISVDARSNGARFVDTGDTMQADQGLQSILFNGHNADSSGAQVQIDTTGRYREFIELDGIGDPGSINAWSTLVLRPIAVASPTANQGITLPIGANGDSIKIVNTSIIDNNGAIIPEDMRPTLADGTTRVYWQISPDATQEIKGLGPSDPLVLDVETASFELLYAGGQMGWVIIGID